MNIITNYIQINKICIYVYILIYHFFRYIFNIQFLLKYHIYILYTWIFEIQANQGSFRLSSIVVSIRGRFRFESGLNDTGMNTQMTLEKCLRRSHSTTGIAFTECFYQMKSDETKNLEPDEI